MVTQHRAVQTERERRQSAPASSAESAPSPLESGRFGLPQGRVNLPPVDEAFAATPMLASELIRAGAGQEGAHALSDVVAAGLVSDASCQRCVALRTVLDEICPVLVATEVSQIRGRLLSVGLAPQRLRELRLLTLAFVYLEVREQQGGAFEHGDDWSLLEDAMALRAELLSACSWNLRSAGVTGTLARISDSVQREELAIDLVELAELVARFGAHFEPDGSFSAQSRVQEALAIAAALRTTAPAMDSTEGDAEGGPDEDDDASAFAARGSTAKSERPVPSASLLFGQLMNCVDEIRAAGNYALRGSPQLARAFASGRELYRRRSRLRDALAR